MSNKAMKQLALMSAMMLAESQHYFDSSRGRVVEQKESPEDRARRERCEQMAIEKAKAKRERKAAKSRRLNAKKEE
jgi:hypothetical protein